MSDWLDAAITKSEQDEELNRVKLWQKWLHAEKERCQRAEQDRDAALAAMWGMICCATELRRSLDMETNHGMAR